MMNQLDWSYIMKRKYERETQNEWNHEICGRWEPTMEYVNWLEDQINRLMNGE
jgi:hypothetical protein